MERLSGYWDVGGILLCRLLGRYADQQILDAPQNNTNERDQTDET